MTRTSMQASCDTRPEALTDRLKKCISGERIKSAATDIYAFDRTFRFPDFHRSAAFCRDRLRRAGLKDVAISTVPADGKTRIHDYVMPTGWDAEDATLTVMTPSGKPRLLASYKDEPISLFTYSAPTPPRGVDAEIVHAKSLDALSKMNLKGKIALIHNPFSRRTGYLVAKRGGIGVITDWAGFPLFSPEGVKWDNYTFFPDNPFKLFGFSISRKDSAYLQKRIAAAERAGKKVMAHATVRTRLYKDKADLVEACIPGTTDEEVIGFAHLFEFGAWDNAAGCAVLLECAAVLRQLIDKGQLPRPRRTIRFLHGFECYGLVAYLARHKQYDHMIAGLNVDGAGVDMCRMQAPLCLFKTPDSNPGFTDPFLARLLRQVLTLSDNEKTDRRAAAQGGPHDNDDFMLTWKASPFGGCDGLPADPWFNVPFPSLVQFSKDIWHNSLDTPDALDPETLRHIALVAGTYLFSIANAGEREAVVMARAQTLDAEHLLKQTAVQYEERILQSLEGRKRVPRKTRHLLTEAQERLVYLYDREKTRLRSLRNLVRTGSADALDSAVHDADNTLAEVTSGAIKTLQSSLEQAAGRPIAPASPRPTAMEAKAMRLVPERLIPGILTLETLPEDVRYTARWLPGYQVLTTPILWVDGQRSIYDIARLVEQETGTADVQDLVECFLFLEKHGYVKLHRRRRTS